MKCSKCGFENKEGSKFCLMCGNRLDEENQGEVPVSEVSEVIEVPDIPDESEVCPADTEAAEPVPEEPAQPLETFADKLKRNKKAVAAASAATVVIIIAGVAISAVSGGKDDAHSEPAAVTEAVYEETTAVTAPPETSATTVRTTKATAATTRATTTTTEGTTAAETEAVKSVTIQSDTIKFDGGKIDFTEYTYHKRNWKVYIDEYINFSAEVTLYGPSEVEDKVNAALAQIGNPPSDEELEESKSIDIEFSEILSKIYNQLETAYIENNVLYVVTKQYSKIDLDEYSYVETFAFDLNTGEQIREGVWNALSDIVGPGVNIPTPDIDVQVELVDVSQADREKLLSDLAHDVDMNQALTNHIETSFADESKLLMSEPIDEDVEVYLSLSYYATDYANQEELYDDARNCFTENYVSNDELTQNLSRNFENYNGQIVWAYYEPNNAFEGYWIPKDTYDFVNAGILSYSGTNAVVWVACDYSLGDKFMVRIFNMVREDTSGSWKIDSVQSYYPDRDNRFDSTEEEYFRWL